MATVEDGEKTGRIVITVSILNLNEPEEAHTCDKHIFKNFNSLVPIRYSARALSCRRFITDGDETNF